MATSETTRAARRTVFRLWVITITAVVTAVAFFFRDVVLILSVGAAGLLATFLYPRFQRAAERRLIRSVLKKADLTGVVGAHTLESTPEALVERSAHKETRAPWGSLYRVERTPQFLAIYLNSTTAHIVPLKGVREGDVSAFEAEVRRRMADARPSPPTAGGA